VTLTARAAAGRGIEYPLRRAQAMLCCLLALAASAAAEPFELQQLSPNTFVHHGKMLPLDAPGHDDIANVGFIFGERCVAVIDTGGSVRIGAALRAAIRAHTALPVCYVINTHVHVDHLLGNAAFSADRPQFVGHQQLGAALARSRDYFLQHYAADLRPPASTAQLIGPDKTVAIGQELTLDLGNRQLLLRAWPSAHTDCDLTVYDPKSGTLWTGDLLFVDRTPALDGSLKGWLSAIDTLQKMPARHFVPGHGADGTDLAAALAAERLYLESLRTEVRAALAHGVSLQQALKDLGAADHGHWQLWESTQPHNVARAYQELEWE
jgi:quinoprotein relay system zinc metallohydrolase 2